MSGLLSSQTLQPIEINGKQGLFIDFNVMDSITVQLIDYRGCIEEKRYLYEEQNTFIDTINEMQKVDSLQKANISDYKTLLAKSNIQLQTQKDITANVKKRAFFDKLLYLAGGVVLGVVLF